VSFSMTGHVDPFAPCFAVSLSLQEPLVCACVWPVQALSTGLEDHFVFKLDESCPLLCFIPCL